MPAQAAGACAAAQRHAKHCSRHISCAAAAAARVPPPLVPQVLGAVYLVWRVLRTLNPGTAYIYSIPFWCALPRAARLYCLVVLPSCLAAAACLHLAALGCCPICLLLTSFQHAFDTTICRLAEFMAYCLSFCFVASLFYMVSWRQRGAAAPGPPPCWQQPYRRRIALPSA